MKKTSRVAGASVVAAAKFLYMLVTFLTVPYYLRWLGDGYGGYLLHWTFAGYFSLLDFGIPYAGQIAVAKASTEGEEARAKTLQGTVFGAMVLLAGLGFVLYLVLGLVLSRYGNDAVRALPMSGYFYVGAYIAAILAIAGVNAVVSAHEDFRTIGGIQIANAVLTSLVPLGFVLVRKTPDALLLGNAVGAWITTLFAVALVSRRYGAGALVSRIDRSSLFELVRVGARLMAIKVPMTLVASTDRLVIGTVSGQKALKDYGVPTRVPESLALLYRSVHETALVSVTRAAQDKATNLVALTERYAMITLSGACALVMIPCAFGAPFLRLWLHENAPAIGPAIMLILACNATLDLFTATAWQAPLAMGRPNVMVKFSVFTGVVRIAASYPMLKYFGPIGVAYVNVAVTALLVLPIYRKSYSLMAPDGSPLPHVLRGARLFGLCLAVCLGCYFASHWLAARGLSILALIVAPFVALGFLLAIRGLRLSPLPDQIERVLAKIPGLGRGVGVPPASVGSAGGEGSD